MLEGFAIDGFPLAMMLNDVCLHGGGFLFGFALTGEHCMLSPQEPNAPGTLFEGTFLR